MALPARLFRRSTVAVALTLTLGGLATAAGSTASAAPGRIDVGVVSGSPNGGDLGLDALGGGGGRICDTGCTEGYSRRGTYSSTGGSVAVPGGTAEGHLEFYPRGANQQYDPWSSSVGGGHLWLRPLSSGGGANVGNVPLPNSGDPTAFQAEVNVQTSGAAPDGRLRVYFFQYDNLRGTSGGYEVGSFGVVTSRGNRADLGWVWAGRYIVELLDTATGNQIQGFADVVKGQPVVFDMEASCFGLAECRYMAGGPSTVAGRYHPLTPTRILDTRDGNGGILGPVGPGDGRNGDPNPDKRAASAANHEFKVTGRAGVPASGVSAVVLNVTATDPTTGSYLTVFPKPPQGSRNPADGNSLFDDQSSYRDDYPNSSNLNFVEGEVAPNLVVVRVGAGGELRLKNLGGTVNVVADVVGWYDTGASAGDGFVGVVPYRVLDTRSGFGGAGTRVDGGERRDLTVAPSGQGGGVPADATAVVMNVTAADPAWFGWVTVFPAGEPQPLASNLNLSPGQTRPNLVVARVGAGGKVGFATMPGGPTDLVADIVGYYTASGGGQVVAVDPQRLFDSRSGLGTPRTPFAQQQTREIQVAGAAGVPGNADAVIMNVTATEPSTSGVVTVYPAGADQPLASNLNFVGGQTVPNLVMVKLGAGGRIAVFNMIGSTQIVGDVVGYVT